MNLIKKTVILTRGTAEGYVSVIRVGNDVGAKIVGTGFEKGMRAGIKIGRGETVFTELEGTKTEIALENVSFHTNDAISCLVLSGERVIASGGNGIKIKDVINHFASLSQSDVSAEVVAAANLEEPEIVTPEPNEETVEEETDVIEPEETDEAEITEDATIEADEEPDEEARAILEKLGSKNGAEFYNGIREKLDELFVIHPREELLDSLIPDSEWIKVAYDDNDYYTVGKIRENGRTVLLGYGVPGKKSVTPPKIADEIASWMDVENLPDGYDGYWLIFQDAVTGKVVNVT